jgi:hypothetical protein
LLNEAVLQYVSFVNWIYGFVPDVSHTAALLRRFSVTELWYAHVAKFPWHDKSLKTTMTHFYARSAAPLLEAARINGTSQVQPRLAEMEYMVSNWDKDFPRRWKIVYDAWEKVFGAESTLTAEPELVAEAVTGAKS